MGLFEDDANVRPVKKSPAPKAKPKPKKKRNVGDAIVGRAESKVKLVDAPVSVGGAVAMDEVDLRGAKTTRKKADTGRIQPPINYVAD